jgi:hypothetical protein
MLTRAREEVEDAERLWASRLARGADARDISHAEGRLFGCRDVLAKLEQEAGHHLP